ncbi:MAG: TolC family protein [Paraburkholderia sp.]|uniref:TolC family protein n=1 Tax=Paraburkholderia sp. TaxID=1926495 RepID=UPI00121F4BBC|nr:TolC family protein [Paraburkholderia sp.]TAM07142.1 MAG: TolC family protein [Paraburkholderia sp.]TAM32688.1 MAG: TolC family protein [Paraburkholderia sp.]
MKCQCRIVRSVSFALLALVPAAPAQAFDIFRTGDTSSATPAAPLLSNASCVSEPVDRPLALEDTLLQAICSHPQARQAWANARAQAAAVGIAKAAYLPTLNATAGIDRDTRSTTYDYGATGLGSQGRSQRSSTQYGILNLSWVLFDFGKRSADLRQARELLAAANAVQDDTLQAVFFSTARAYYAVRDAHASVDAAWQTERIADESLAAARAKHDAGAGTLSDRLQAQTTYRRAVLDRVSAEGDARTAIGELAVSMGRDANTPVQIIAADSVPDENAVAAGVDALIDEAKMRQPKLAAARARLAAARANVEAVRAQSRPTISMTGSLTQNNPSTRQQADSFSISRSRSSKIGVQLTIPLFEGFASGYRFAHAQSLADAQEADLHNTELQVSLDVWRSYQALQADAINLTTSRDLLDDAQRSLEIARGRYKEGVGTFIELLNAQTALADAQKQRVLAVSKWRTARLSLAASLGKLGLWTMD